MQMKSEEKRKYLNKFIKHLKNLGWGMYEPTIQDFSLCDELEMFGDELIYNKNKFSILVDIVELFEDGFWEEAMDLSHSIIGEPGIYSFSKYFAAAQKDEVFPWLG